MKSRASRAVLAQERIHPTVSVVESSETAWYRKNPLWEEAPEGYIRVRAWIKRTTKSQIVLKTPRMKPTWVPRGYVVFPEHPRKKKRSPYLFIREDFPKIHRLKALHA